MRKLQSLRVRCHFPLAPEKEGKTGETSHVIKGTETVGSALVPDSVMPHISAPAAQSGLVLGSAPNPESPPVFCSTVS